MGISTPFVVLGTKGTALPLKLLKLTDGLVPGANIVPWSTKNVTSLAAKTEAWISKVNEPFDILEREKALNEGIIKALSPVFWTDRENRRYKGTAYLKRDWQPSDPPPQYVAVDCPEWGHGVVETKRLGKRNSHRAAIIDFSQAREVTFAKERGLSTVSNESEPEEPGEFYDEGKERVFIGTAYERDSQARAECIRNYGCKCFVCGFDFAQEYGETGEGFIHVHHEIPVRQGERGTDAIKDLKPVCPNCHAMIHRQKEPLPIEHLKRLVEERRAQRMYQQVQ